MRTVRAGKLSVALVGGGLLSAVATVGWPALVVLAVVATVAVAAACWVLNDRERPKRLALLIRACRGQGDRPRQAARREVPPSPWVRPGRPAPPARQVRR